MRYVYVTVALIALMVALLVLHPAKAEELPADCVVRESTVTTGFTERQRIAEACDVPVRRVAYARGGWHYVDGPAVVPAPRSRAARVEYAHHNGARYTADCSMGGGANQAQVRMALIDCFNANR